MTLDYTGPTTIKLDRVLPKFPNSCRQSVLANAINYLTGTKSHTPESVLAEINRQRSQLGKNPIDLSKETLEDLEIDSALHTLAPELSVIRLNGDRYIDLILWRQLLDKQFILVSDHQMIYTDPLNLEKNEINYIPEPIRTTAVIDPKFNYQTLLDLYDFYLSRAGLLSEGHVDLVLETFREDDLDYLVLANMASFGNEKLIKVPFNFFKNYLTFDWHDEKPIKSTSDLPTAQQMKQLQQFGFLQTPNFSFVLGQIEIYYQTSRRSELDQILL